MPPTTMRASSQPPQPDPTRTTAHGTCTTSTRPREDILAPSPRAVLLHQLHVCLVERRGMHQLGSTNRLRSPPHRRPQRVCAPAAPHSPPGGPANASQAPHSHLQIQPPHGLVQRAQPRQLAGLPTQQRHGGHGWPPSSPISGRPRQSPGRRRTARGRRHRSAYSRVLYRLS